MPEYPGGQQALGVFIARNVDYPQQAIDANIDGTVYVRFIVDKSGQVKNPSILRSVSPLLDSAAIDVCRLIPDFAPGMQAGEPISVWYSLPIKFQSHRDNTKNN